MSFRFPKTRLCKLSCIQIRRWVRRDGIRLDGWRNSRTSGWHVIRFQKSWETCMRQGIGIEKRIKKINSSSEKASEVKLVGIQRNEVYEHIISNFHRTFSCCLTFGYHLFSYVDNSHTYLFQKMRYNNSFCASHNTYLSNFDFLVCFLSSLGCKT